MYIFDFDCVFLYFEAVYELCVPILIFSIAHNNNFILQLFILKVSSNLHQHFLFRYFLIH